MKIAVCVPTIRQDKFRDEFLPAWDEVFKRHEVEVFACHDGETPEVIRLEYDTYDGLADPIPSMVDISAIKPILFNRSDVCRNAAFYAAKKTMDPDVYISLDDDVTPWNGNDPIQEHLDVLAMSVKIDWINTSYTYRMRGLPYEQKEYPVLLSHGVWKGVPDFDAITQIQNPAVRDISFPRNPVPRGIFIPISAMNFAFRKEVLPYAYQAPMGQRLAIDFNLPQYDRFGDIWAGVVMKYAIDNILGGAVVTGYSTVHHDRASDVYTNLRKEAVGMELNEVFYTYMDFFFDPVWSGLSLRPSDGIDANYIELYRKKLSEWQKLIQ